MHQPLPLELTCIILDFLRHEKTSLSSCSLVCKTWLDASQKHLFCKITLIGSPETYSSFRRCINSHLRSYVKSVSLRPAKFDIADGYSSATITHTTLDRVLDALPALHSITIQGFTLRSQQNSSVISSLDTIKSTWSIRSLHLDQVTIPGFTHIASVLGAFQHIDTLKLTNIYISENLRGLSLAGLRNPSKPIASSVSSSPISIRSIITDGPDTVHALDYLRQIPQIEGTVDSLHVAFPPPLSLASNASAGATGRFLQHVARRLEHIDFDFSDCRILSAGDQKLWTLLKLEECDALQSFHVRMYLEYDDPTYPANQWKPIIALLSRLPPSVTKLTLTVHYLTRSRVPGLEFLKFIATQIDWERLRGVLERHEFEEVVINETWVLTDSGLSAKADIVTSPVVIDQFVDERRQLIESRLGLRGALTFGLGE